MVLSLKGDFPFIIFFDPYLIIKNQKILLCKILNLTKIIEKFPNQKHKY